MANSRKQLISEIAQLEQTLHHQQCQAMKHKKYLINVIAEYKVVFLAILLPSFFLGWKVGRGKWFSQMIKQIIELGMFAAASHFKRQLVNVFRQ